MKVFNRFRVFLFLFCAIISPVDGAKTHQQLKDEFSALLGANKFARIVWIKGGNIGRNMEELSTNFNIATQLYCLDTKDGNIRKLTPDSLRSTNYGKLENPTFTWDGKRIVFFSGKKQTVYIINWDGSGLRTVATGMYSAGTWRDEQGADWVCITKASGTNGLLGNVYRMKIDDPSQQVLLWDKTRVSHSQYGFWATLSLDGKYMASCFPWPNSGIASVSPANGSLVTVHSNSCWPSMARDNTYRCIFQFDDHEVLGMRGLTGSMTTYGINNAVSREANNSCIDVEEHNTTRWSNDPDIISFFMYNTRANPFVMRLSNLRYVAINDAIVNCEWEGCADVFVYSGSIDQNTAPSIVQPADANAQINRATQIVIQVNGNPLPTLSATGLPPGMTLANGSTPASSFTISGTPTQTGTFTVQLTATNSIGTDTKSFRITVGADNARPTVNAGRDTTFKTEIVYALAGSATDDGKPNARLAIAWRQVSGPAGGSVIGDTTNPTSTISFKTAGTYLLELKAYDGEFTVRDTVRITVTQRLPFIVIKPAAGDRVTIGTTTTIQWQVEPEMPVKINLSTDDGLTWISLTPDSVVNGQNMTWQWRVSNTLEPSDNCFIQLSDYNGAYKSQISGKFSLVKGGSSIFSTQARKTGSTLVIRIRGRQVMSLPVDMNNNIEISIVDYFGRRLARAKGTTGELNLDNKLTATGTYFLRIGLQGKMEEIRFVLTP